MKVYKCEAYDYSEKVNGTGDIGETLDYGLFSSIEAAETHMTKKFSGLGSGFVIEDSIFSMMGVDKDYSWTNGITTYVFSIFPIDVIA